MVQFLVCSQGQNATDTLTDGWTEPQRCYYIPCATRCEGIINTHEFHSGGIKIFSFSLIIPSIYNNK